MTGHIERSRSRIVWRVIGKTLHLGFAGFTSILAVFLAVVIFLVIATVTIPPVLIVLVIFLGPLTPKLFLALAETAAPTAFILLPAVALFTPERHGFRKLALFSAGALGGALTTLILPLQHSSGYPYAELLSGGMLGAVAGLAFGATLDPP